MAKARRIAMVAAIALRDDYDGARLRALAKASQDANQTRRLLCLAVIYEGGRRSEAAALGGVGILRGLRKRPKPCVGNRLTSARSASNLFMFSPSCCGVRSRTASIIRPATLACTCSALRIHRQNRTGASAMRGARRRHSRQKYLIPTCGGADS